MKAPTDNSSGWLEWFRIWDCGFSKALMSQDTFYSNFDN